MNTPVVFIIFNRPDTTEKVFEVIRQAQPSKLFVIADGSRHEKEGEAEKCSQTRAIINRVDWHCEVITNFSENNLGCRKRISSGLDWVFSQVEEAIILEDDCVPHPSFFKYCEKLLEKYRHDERIMMISGNNFLLDQFDISETYTFSRYTATWGWATWRRAWKTYDVDIKHWEKLKAQKFLSSLFSQDYVVFWLTSCFDQIRNYTKVDTWDYQWFYTCLFNNGLCIVPKLNLVTNIGVNGTHAIKASSFHLLPSHNLDMNNIQHPDLVIPNFTYDDLLFDKKLKPKNLASMIKFKLLKIKYMIP
ncbi:glycosyltransferase [Calothrix rhizosoleniae]|uniref:glycosyltransferase n=1 Tax=Calothrix rhizosoleniae TaxID=888997 RepID=UPI000B49AACB|nr:glycosyltransferase [Calothrix rhizosoleniae]